MKRTITVALTAATLLGATFAPASASHRYYRGYGYYHHHDYGGAVAAGVVGLAAGAMIGAAMASPPAVARPPATSNPNLAAYCARKYRSFDPYSGTFLAKSGERIVCTYP